MPIFKRLEKESDLRVSMIGLRRDNRVLQIGGSAPDLIARLAAVVGLNGQASALVPDDSASEALTRAAGSRGALVDVKVAPLRAPPFAEGWFDVVVIPELIGACGRTNVSARCRARDRSCVSADGAW